MVKRKLIDGLTKLLAGKFGLLLVMGSLVIAGAVYLTILSLLVFTRPNVVETKKLTKEFLEEVKIKLEKEKQDFTLEMNAILGITADGSAPDPESIRALQDQINEYYQAIEWLEFTGYTAKGINHYIEPVEPYGHLFTVPRYIMQTAAIGGTMALKATAGKLEGKLIQKEQQFFDEFRYYIPKEEEIDWKHLMTFAAVYDKQISDEFFSSIENVDLTKLSAEDKKKMEEMQKTLTTKGLEFNAQKLKEILSIYFKRLDYVTEQVVLYEDKKIKNAIEIPGGWGIPPALGLPKPLWKTIKIRNVSIVPKTTEELCDELKLNKDDRRRVYASLAIDLAIDEDPSSTEEYINQTKTKLSYTEKENKYGEKVMEPDKTTEHFTSVILTDPKEKDIISEKLIDPVLTKTKLEALVTCSPTKPM